MLNWQLRLALRLSTAHDPEAGKLFLNNLIGTVYLKTLALDSVCRGKARQSAVYSLSVK